jgi:MFS family permease
VTSARRPYYGWVIVGVGALAVFGSSPGQTYVASVFVDPITRDTGWSRTLISGVYTLGSLTAAPAMFAVGQLLDRFGARAALSLVIILFGAAALAMNWVTHPFHLYVGFTFLRLLGQGSMTVIPTAMVALWFIRLRGRALSLTALGAVAGQAVFPPLVYLLITRMGWRTAWLVLAFGIWVVLLPPVLLLVRRDPESVGLRPDGSPP